MGVSKNNGTPKSSILFSGFPLFSPSILGYHYFWKHPHDTRYHSERQDQDFEKEWRVAHELSVVRCYLLASNRTRCEAKVLQVVEHHPNNIKRSETIDVLFFFSRSA